MGKRYIWNLKCGYCNISVEVLRSISDYIDCPECKRKLKVTDGVWIEKETDEKHTTYIIPMSPPVKRVNKLKQFINKNLGKLCITKKK